MVSSCYLRFVITGNKLISGIVALDVLRNMGKQLSGSAFSMKNAYTYKSFKI